MLDFDALYRRLPTEELLGIIQHPELHQPGAVDAAKRVLAGRGLREEQLNDAAELRAPSSQLDPRKWVYGLCIVLFLSFLFSIPQLRDFIRMQRLGSIYAETHPASWIIACTWVLPLLIIALLLRQKRSGWMLAVFFAAFQLSFSVYGLVSLWKYRPQIWLINGTWITLYLVMLVLLRRKSIMGWCSGSVRLWGQMLLVGVVMAGLAMIAVG